MRGALEGAGVPIESGEVAMIAKQTVAVDASKARQNLRLVEHLEDLEDVQRVTSNLELTDEILRRGRRVIVLGIDPGTASLGYGLIDRTGSRLRAVDFGAFHTGADLPLPERLLAIHVFLEDLIELHAPDLRRGGAGLPLPQRPDRAGGRPRPRGRAARGGGPRARGPRGDTFRGQASP